MVVGFEVRESKVCVWPASDTAVPLYVNDELDITSPLVLALPRVTLGLIYIVPLAYIPSPLAVSVPILAYSDLSELFIKLSAVLALAASLPDVSVIAPVIVPPLKGRA